MAKTSPNLTILKFSWKHQNGASSLVDPKKAPLGAFFGVFDLTGAKKDQKMFRI